MKDLLAQYADKYELDPLLVQALITIESNGDQWAIRHEPHYKWLYKPQVFSAKLGITAITEKICQQTSWGLMQIMGAVAREHGFNLPMPILCLPEHNLDIGCKFLKSRIDLWGIKGGLCAYNAGTPDSSIGEKYAAKVLAKYRELSDGDASPS